MLGSPPRMRGKEGMEQVKTSVVRITPAYAGKRAPTAARRLTLGDHPRVCGEKRERSSTSGRGGGSPPRMRGKAQYEVQGDAPPGITPAYAGKRQTTTDCTQTGRDHPRVCGEKYL